MIKKILLGVVAIVVLVPAIAFAYLKTMEPAQRPVTSMKVDATPERAQAWQPIDLYSYTHPMRYNVREYANFPPWARIETIAKHLGKYTMSDAWREEGRPFLDSLEPGPLGDLLAERARQDADRRKSKQPTRSASSSDRWD